MKVSSVWAIEPNKVCANLAGCVSNELLLIRVVEPDKSIALPIGRALYRRGSVFAGLNRMSTFAIWASSSPLDLCCGVSSFPVQVCVSLFPFFLSFFFLLLFLALVATICSQVNGGNCLHIAAANLSLESAKILVSG